jgi:predicted P-loop ATPase
MQNESDPTGPIEPPPSEEPCLPMEPAKAGLSAPSVPSGESQSKCAARGSVPPRSELERALPLNPSSFPNQPKLGSSQVPTTIANVRHMLEAYGIICRYNVTKKKIVCTLPGQAGTPDNVDSVALNHIFSLAALNRMRTGLLQGFVATIADGTPWNPVADWIRSRPWDGVDRLEAVYKTLRTPDGFDDALKRRIIYCWLLSCVAAACKLFGFFCRGVLTLQGPQGIGKTRWIAALVSNDLLRDEVVRLGHHLDARNKDDIVSALSHWIVEIGELDSSFRKDVAALKGFLTNNHDKLRRPYGRVDSEYPRRTVFAATVNDAQLLVDTSGNTRFWTLPVVAVDYRHGIDMQQLFAQLLIDFEKGVEWWLTDEEQCALEERNRDHRAASVIRELIESGLDLARRGDAGLKAMSATEVLGRIGLKHLTNSQARECGSVLRDLLGPPKKIQGVMKWRVPFRKDEPLHPSDEDLY